MKRSFASSAGPWLIGGGLIILVAYHLLNLPLHGPSVDVLAMTGGAVLGYVILGAGIYLMGGAGRHGTATPPLPASERSFALKSLHSTETVIDRLLSEYSHWLESATADGRAWVAFDQLVREIAATYLHAAHVRCFHVSAEDATLRGLTSSDENKTERLASARSGILGHVATTGRLFVSGDRAQGELVQRLADEAEQKWQLVWPIRREGRTIGLIAIGELQTLDIAVRTLCETVLRLTELVWCHLICRVELDRAQSTDKASGVLTRDNFFSAASRSLAESHSEREPVVLAVLALEGLRGLDDGGAWRLRDSLVEQTGRELSRRTRSDDIVGRFSDDRFVMLLRRLDSGLGRLIARKLVEGVQNVIANGGERTVNVSVRIGLVGSGFGQTELDELLVAAFDAAERARRENERIWIDMDAVADARSQT
ncbi:MAG: diguanylate cyclase [Phycisphaerae bacterium]|nr:diguanylate cyclase [Phycisphaerae bacterium]